MWLLQNYLKSSQLIVLCEEKFPVLFIILKVLFPLLNIYYIEREVEK